MFEKKLNSEQLEKVSGGGNGGEGEKYTSVNLRIYYYENDSTEEMCQPVGFFFTVPCTDDIIKEAAKRWCEEENYRYSRHEVIKVL